MSTDDADDDAALFEAPPTLDSVDELLAEAVHAPRLPPPPTAGSRIGRYELIERLGAGAMGEVWAASDPQLGRKVALKILRRDPRISDTGGRERAAREARALAKLVHPNIVAVHDAGVERDALYVVMELVDGVTLRAWLAETPRSRDEILDAFDQAAAGLAAAHDANLVHRDFKPDNVLVGKDGRVRVADFGLARIASATDDGLAPTPGAANVGAAATVTGGFVGTPAFMAPEQMTPGGVDARADQFAFAVSLWTALYGAPPFEGKTIAARREAIEAGPRAPASDRGVPAWLGAILRRGVAARPDERFPSIGAMRAAITRGRGRRRRIATAVGAVIVAGALTPVVWLAATRPSAPDEVCGGGAAEIAGVWTPARAAAIAATFPGTDAGRHAADRVRARLDGYAGDWARAHRDACRATRVDRSQSEDMLDRRMACLARAKIRLDALVAHFGGAGAEPERVELAADELPRLAHCADLVALARLVPVPDDPDVRGRIDAATTRLAALQTSIYGADASDQVDATRAAAEQAREACWAPLTAEATWTHAEALYLRESYDEAVPVYREAVRLGLEGGDDGMTVFAMVDLGRALSSVGASDEARRWLELGRAVAKRSGDPPRLRIRIAQSASYVSQRLGDFDDAVAQTQAVVALLAEAGGAQGSYYAVELANLATALTQAGKLEEAVAVYERAIAMEVAAHGDAHPAVAEPLTNRGIALVYLGRLDDARRDLTRALEMAVAWYGDGASQTIRPRQALAMAELRGGAHDAARVQFQRALEIAVAHDLPGPTRAEIEANLGILEAESGNHQAAIAHGRSALAGFEAMFGPDDPMLRPTLILIGRAERELGRHDDSKAHLARALELAEAAGADHPWTGNTRIEVALTETARGRHDQAIALCERVLADAAAGVRFPPFVEPEARLCLADALWRAGRDRTRARRLATESRDGFSALGDGYAKELRSAEQWIAAHP